VDGVYVTQHNNLQRDPLFFDVDICILGAGEIPLKLILQRYLNNSNQFFGIPNIYWNQNGKLQKNVFDNTVFCNPMAVIPVRPANIFEMHGNKELSIASSRGCPGKCSYCTIAGQFHGQWFARTPDDIIYEAQAALNDQAYERVMQGYKSI